MEASQGMGSLLAKKNVRISCSSIVTAVDKSFVGCFV